MQSLTFEISLKPFWNLDDEGTRQVCAAAFRQWDALARQASEISILLWAADGSEILEYAGDLDAEMEWARYLGNSNPHNEVPNDPEKKSLHSRNYLYRADTQPITYRRLAAIVRAWREVAATAPATAGKKLSIGLPFDPGGEFAPSEFKYKRHREICLANTMGKASFVCCYGILDSDTRRYAGFPQGIPQDTGIGTFLGRQFRHLAHDLGFDFLWLSNGFGFGMETWHTIGPLFDAEAFHPGRAPELRDRILGFWRDLRQELPSFIGIRTRGTNLGTATDLASDATPLRELYEGGFDFDPPPNSPWAALNGDFGIELAGYMTRVAELPPGRGFVFRYYIHDPWWFNTPWLDRYEGQPHDIYLPLSVGRIDASGRVDGARTLNLITLDDSYGRMPDVVPNQATPHLLRAWEGRPDSAGPLVWLYPFDEIHDAMFGAVPAPERLFHTDWFVREAINDGLPLNTVISTRAFAALGEARARKVLGGRILVTPTPFDEAGEQRLLAWVEGGGSLIMYGSLDAAPTLRAILGLLSAAPLAGDMMVDTSPDPLDVDESDTARPATFNHNPIMSGGALSEAAASSETEIIASCTESTANGERRVLAVHHNMTSGGQIGWLRGPLPLRMIKGIQLPVADAPASTFAFAELVRQMLTRQGWHISFRASTPDQRHPVLSLHRHTNAWIFSGYMPDTTVELVLRTPFGAPLLLGTETRLRDGQASFRLPRAWRHECRVFIEQADGVVGCIERHPAQIGVIRRLLMNGLKDATIRFFPPPGAGPVHAYLNIQWPNISGETIPLRQHETPHGRMLETTLPATGSILLSWGDATEIVKPSNSATMVSLKSEYEFAGG